MKPQRSMIWKVTVEWKGEQVTYETDGHIGKFIALMKDTFKGCTIVERWQEPTK
jgi:hypothetical protein